MGSGGSRAGSSWVALEQGGIQGPPSTSLGADGAHSENHYSVCAAEGFSARFPGWGSRISISSPSARPAGLVGPLPS